MLKKDSKRLESASSPHEAAAGRAASTGKSPAKAQEGEYQFLPVECPNCGLEGKVKISRLDRTFTCKQCKKVFHITLDGTVSGERPPEATLVDPAEVVSEETQTRLEKWLAALPRAWQIVLAGVCLLALGYGVKVLTEPVEPLPGELEDRAAFAAKALARGEWGQMKRLALSGAAKDLRQWYDAARPASWADVDAESQVKVQVGSISKQLQGYEKNQPILDSVVPVTIEVRGKGKPQELNFIFSQDKELEWWLNGERMLKRLQPQKEAKPAGKGKK